ncbi:hypothetical protein L228DRAFT_100708 [Xylona heveae TC161]|uniref:Uncharacterized protein n=1 Tax=Xylona heveae (strain CBS 132557 / TC161) TaxID=1328760 RepID=A0A165IAS3_XYLHT|nr:hypothetical protein L228DRAFT_100708 [Xylona heveae TC161]KZF24638.1 hypothetical protein L228DRAFT_100708 [Xylona heveae TC161]
MASGQAPWNVKSAQRHLGLGGGQIPASGSEELQSEPIRIEPGRSVSGEEQPDQQSGSSGPSVSTDSGPSYPWISNIPSRRTLHHPSQPLPSLKGEDTSLSSISSMSSGISAGSTSSMPSRTMLPPLSRIDETNSQRSLPSLAASLSQGHLDQSPSMAHPSSAQQSPVAPYGPYQHTPPSEESTTLPPLGMYMKTANILRT